MRIGLAMALWVAGGCSVVSDFGGFHGGSADSGPTCNCPSTAPFCDLGGCRACVAGEYLDFVGGAIDCAPCEPQTFSASWNASTCEAWRDCPPGTFTSSAADPTTDRGCTPCVAGTFTAAPNQTECREWYDCPPGTITTSEGNASTDRSCEACPDGQTNALSNATTCRSALFGRDYSAYPGDGDCLVLPSGALDCSNSVHSSLVTTAFSQVTVGGSVICAIEESGAAEGTIYCWSTLSLELIELPFDSADDVVVGDEHVCARRSAGLYSCANGGPRDAAYQDVAITTVGGLGDHGCGVRGDGSLECWGALFDGGLPVPTGTFTHIAARFGEFCALHQGNRLECFTPSEGAVENRPSPPLPEGRRWETLEFGCLLDDQGAPFCWQGSIPWADVPFRLDTVSMPPFGEFRCGILQGTGGLLCWDELGLEHWRGIPFIDMDA